MMTIKWQDRRTNLSVLEQVTMCSVERVFVKNQLRWSGHVVRMENNRLPKQMFYSELTEGKRDVGGQKKRFKDGLKSHLNQCAIDTKEWENLAMNTTIWRKAIRDGVEKFEERRSKGIRLKRERKKETQEQPRTELPPGLCCPECDRQFKARIGLYSHYRTHHQSMM